MNDLQKDIFNITSENRFRELALEIFRFQAQQNAVYKAFIGHLRLDPQKIQTLEDIPYLPIELFKTTSVISGDKKPEKIFLSSGTTGENQSRHYVCDIGIYRSSFLQGFELFYGKPEEYVIFALLPSYMEREGSSLVYMAGELIRRGKKGSGFFLYNYEELINEAGRAKAQGHKHILLGVSHALLDLAEKSAPDLKGAIVMETGGMKGRRKELIREELHGILQEAFNITSVHSEYGMTELLSQAYSKGEGLFRCPPWMKILIRDAHDPFSKGIINRSGGINVIDLANLYSCSFLATQDLGICYPGGSFRILGRFDNSDIRGCNLLIN